MMVSLLPMGASFAQTEEASVGKGPKYGTDSVNCVMNLSLYREFYKQNNYVDALPRWRWVFVNCPQSSQNLYIDGARLISDRIEKTTDPVEREKYIDTLMMIYDQRIENFDREAYVLGRKGIEMITYRPQNIEENYQTLKKSVEMAGHATEAATVAYYYQSILAMVQQEKLDKIAVVEAYDQLSDIIDHNISANQDKPNVAGNWSNIKGNIEVAFEPFASCEDLLSIYEKKYAESPEDVELLAKITNMLERKDCVSSDLFYSATRSLHRLQPTAKSAYLMGTLSREKKEYSDAIEYLNQAVQLFDNNDDKIKALNLLAAVYYEQRNYSQARANALRITQINPNYGKAYLFIGDLYASSSSMCNDDDLSGKTVFWAAVDMYVRARNADPSIADEANSKISQYSKYFPASSDLFFRDLQEGASYTVGCWINETTTIRGIK